MPINIDYPGDTAWFNYVETIKPMWTSFSKKDELIVALNGCEDLAVTAYFAAGEHALDWVDEPIPALGMGIPRAFAENDGTRNILRSVLMRCH